VRDDFDLKTKEILAKRVGYRCSNPGCRKLTSGPRSDPAPTPPPAQPRPQSARCPNHHQTTPGSVDPRTLAPIPSLRPLRRAGRLLHSERTAPDRISHVERHELRLHRAVWAARSPAPAASEFEVGTSSTAQMQKLTGLPRLRQELAGNPQHGAAISG